MTEALRSRPRVFALIITAMAALAVALSFLSPLARALAGSKPIYGLLIGTDWVDNARHADTIVFVRYNPASRALDLLSIPRDTRIDYPGLRVRRINEVYTYAYKANHRDHQAATQELMRVVQWLVFSGADRHSAAPAPGAPEIRYYAQVDYDGFKKIIDLLGGVRVTVDEPMHYDDNWGNLHIHFDRGEHQLNGQKALEYVRYRGMSGDYGRVQRQQEFLLKILQRFKNPVNLTMLPRIVQVSLESIRSNLNWYEYFLLALELKSLAPENVRLMQLPGRLQSGYWIPQLEGIRATAALLNGKAAAPAPPSESSGRPARKTTVEVWNASGRKGLALDVVRQLRAAGFDVVKWGNYSSRQLRTLVRDHSGNIDEARAIARALESPRVEVFTTMEERPLVDVEVILGEDYELPAPR